MLIDLKQQLKTYCYKAFIGQIILFDFNLETEAFSLLSDN